MALEWLTNAFTGAPAAQANQNIQDAFARLGSNVTNLANTGVSTGTNALLAGRTGALGSVGTGVTTARGDVSGALPPALAALYRGQDLGAAALGGGTDQSLADLRSGVTNAVGAYSPLMTAATSYGGYGDNAARMYSDALGLNGPEGIARATAAFQTSPGYDWTKDQAIQGAVRGANVGGGAFGGNTLDAVTRLASNLGNQEYGSWLDRTLKQAQLYSPLQVDALKAYGSGAGNAYLTGGTGTANIRTGAAKSLADLYSGTGANAANLYTGTGKSLADLAYGGGTTGAGIYTSTGGNIANLIDSLTRQQIGFNQAQLAPTAKGFEDQAQAEMLGSQNLWNFAGNLATLGAKGVGGTDFFNNLNLGAPFIPKNLGSPTARA